MSQKAKIFNGKYEENWNLLRGEGWEGVNQKNLCERGMNIFWKKMSYNIVRFETKKHSKYIGSTAFNR